MPPPLGWIEPLKRTSRQHAAHAKAAATFLRFNQLGLQPVQLDKGQKVALYDFWRDDEVVADVGFVGSRIHQKTGSCVWAGGDCAAYTSICVKRKSPDEPIKAFWPFTLHNYASSRARFGDTNEGEGSLGSTFAASLEEDGLWEWPVKQGDEFPDYTQDEENGCIVGGQVELRWSSIRNPNYNAVLKLAKPHPAATTELRRTSDMLAMIQNGYAITFACNLFIGDASIQGSGDEACVIGKPNSRGGHQWSVLAAWEHPRFGLLFWNQNNWHQSTYPRDPAGGPWCGCWVREADQQRTIDTQDAEVYSVAAATWFPAQPYVIDYANHL